MENLADVEEEEEDSKWWEKGEVEERRGPGRSVTRSHYSFHENISLKNLSTYWNSLECFQTRVAICAM